MSEHVRFTEDEAAALAARLNDAGRGLDDATLELARVLFVEKRADLYANQGRWEIDRLLETMTSLCMARINVSAVQTRLE